ncbi:hypothetical protein Glove_91g24 [Diversispora epigaea]|uniref:Uncharacterized protein n=1 Tax=Diversispora epigaea TaxID=1348612 RepID=A0A397JFY7_9GLOM|nr:hypothetical protein Glove_91g24 [Diversispora epigaea]
MIKKTLWENIVSKMKNEHARILSIWVSSMEKVYKKTLMEEKAKYIGLKQLSICSFLNIED